ncbi:MmgE/PrpD family protein [Amycolatopsis sp. K13G38]|uniref:MmgE/PrpD family protein n=1 Tax=Amycolatopsis acididurans TaxID=2724524 RepID=A0ABX1IX49_9PSEU|nr:MmgE/PrpD family protein [Amycolatopsis acididurans]NKQ51776.1 MmgE/PrpD family protein [Amycolatopsis acididurans]
MLTAAVTEFAARLREEPLPPEVVAHVKRLLLDYLGGVVAASRYPTAKLVAGYAAVAHAGGDATAVGFGPLTAEGAALVNGTAAHSLEVDDGYTPGSVHPSAVAFPAVIAAAERHGASPERLLAGAAVALELTCRLAASGHPATWRNGFHNTPLAGVVAGAAGVSTVLGLDARVTEHALGIAASHAGGLFAFLGQDAEVKRLHAGKAARDAVASAELAARGLTGPAGVLEGTKGYFEAFAHGDYDPDVLTGGLGTQWAMLRTYVKPYPCCRHLHGPIDAALRLREHGLDGITRITVGTYTVASHHNASTVDSFLAAQMSIPYALAVALLCGEVGLAEFGDETRARPDVRALAAKVEVNADPAADAVYPKERPSLVTVFAEGREPAALRVAQPYGEPDNPVSDEALEAKFRRLCTSVLGEAGAGAAIEAIRELKDLSFLPRLGI